MPSRREFLGLVGVGALTKLGSRLTSDEAKDPGSGYKSSGFGPNELAEGGGTNDPSRDIMGAGNPKAYGAGYFGDWITDQFGLPAYRYTCDQTSDPKAQTPVHKEWRGATDHTHQVGNDRLAAAVSNYGYIQVRQDEGSPKFLNDYSPENDLYGGGVGFLTDGKTILSTYYPGGADSFERIFGAGYFRKVVKGVGYEIDQVIFAPFGDDPVLISQVTITNRGSETKKLRWLEYWGCQPYQFSYRSFMEAAMQGGAVKTPELRRRFAERFSHEFQAVESGAGILEKKKFLGRSHEDERAWQGLQGFLKKNPNTFLGGPTPDPPPRAGFDDLTPPATFLISLDGPLSGFTSNAKAFFGTGGIGHPSGLAEKLDNSLASTGPKSALLAERTLELAPGESRSMYFLYGYLPEGFVLEELAAKYKKTPASQWRDSSMHWKTDGVRLRVASEPWVERETAWHNYYLRSNLTYDSFFGEHILSQGHVYQYIMGFQGAARDPLQHAMPFIFSRPETVREVLRYTLKEIQADGSIPYGIVGSGVPMPTLYRPSDQELWLLWLAAEYVLATRDTAFLEEKIPAYPRRDPGPEDATVGRLLALCCEHVTVSLGSGVHGLMRLSNGDWNDSLVVGNISPEMYAAIRAFGESVLNAAMASFALDHYSRMLKYVGNSVLADHVRIQAAAQRDAVREQWTGQWFRRAWLASMLGWVGEKQIWLEPQPWAIIGGAATPEQAVKLVDTIDKSLRRPSPIGAMLHAEPMSQMGLPAGILTNGGIWPSINGTLIWALALVDGAMAWDEWKKNTLAAHAEAYPEVWYGIWSGPDSYNSTLSKYPGQTMFAQKAAGDHPAVDWGLNWTDFPVMNMHPHAWPLYSAVKLLGLEFTDTGLAFRPGLPLDDYELDSPLLGFKKSRSGYSGWYAPAKAGQWSVEIKVSQPDFDRLKRIEVNGDSKSVVRPSDAVIRFTGSSEPGKPLRWKITK
jgi:hypothetical protein